MTTQNAASLQSSAPSSSFDYEKKTWGAHTVGLSPTYLGALRLRYCLEDLQPISGCVLEVGCGAGGMAKAIRRYRPDLAVAGCDISTNAIELASAEPQGVEFKQGDAYRLPYDSGQFQAVVMFDVLEHLDEPASALSEIQRVLDADGIFHLYSPCEGEIHSLHGLLDRMGWKAKEQFGGHVQRFTATSLCEISNGCGLFVERMRWSGHLLNQIADAAYFTWLGVRGKNTQSSVEGYLAGARPTPLMKAIRLAKSTIAVASYLESRPLGWLPGVGVHITFGKWRDFQGHELRGNG